MPQLGRYAALADSGTRIHNWLSGSVGETLSAEELRIAKSCAAAKEKLIMEWRETLPAGLGLVESIEERRFLHAGILPVCSGKWDLLATSDRHHLLIDYKTGWQELPPTKQNLQLRVYALLAWADAPDAESISVAIVRPGDEERESAYFATYLPTELESAWIWWEQVLSSVFAPSPVLVSGDHCQFCKAQHTCAARLNDLHTLRVGSQQVTAWADLEPAQKSDLLKLWKQVAKFGSALEDKVREDLENGVALPGVHIGKGRTLRKIDDAQAAYARAIAAGMTHEQFMALIEVSFAKLRDGIQKIAGWKVKEANDKAGALFSGLVTETTTRGALEVA